MFRIIRLEINQYIRDPLVYGFFLLPFLLLLAFTPLFGVPRTLSTIIFIQTLLVSLFVYGNKIMVYKNQTISKKITNSNLSWKKIILSLIIINVVFTYMTLLIPMIYAVTNSHSVKWIEENQFWYFSTTTFDNTILKAGLDQEYLLFTSTIYTWLQFLYAYFMVNLLTLSFASLLAFWSKDQVKYFSLTIVLSLIIILVSSVFSKDMYIMTTDAYTLDSQMISNGLWQLFKRVNPFYWVNQLLVNSIVADAKSGNWVEMSSVVNLGSVNDAINTIGGLENISTATDEQLNALLTSVEVLMDNEIINNLVEQGVINNPLEQETIQDAITELNLVIDFISGNKYYVPAYFNIFIIGTTADPNVNTFRPIVLDFCEMSQILTLIIPAISSFSFITFALLGSEVKR